MGDIEMELMEKKHNALEREIRSAYEMIELMFAMEGYSNSQGCTKNYQYDKVKIQALKLTKLIETGEISLNYTFDIATIMKRVDDIIRHPQYNDTYGVQNSYNFHVQDAVENMVTYASKKQQCGVLDGESFLSLMMIDVYRPWNVETIIKWLNLDLNYKISANAFGKDNRFIRMLASSLCNDSCADKNRLAQKYDLVLNFLKSKNIDDENKEELINKLVIQNDDQITEFLVHNVFESDWFKASSLSKHCYDQTLALSMLGNKNYIIENYIFEHLPYNPLALVKASENKYITMVEHALINDGSGNRANRIISNPNFNIKFFDESRPSLYHDIFACALSLDNYSFAIEWLEFDKDRFDIDIIKSAHKIVEAEPKRSYKPEIYSKKVGLLYQTLMCLALREDDLGKQEQLLNAIEKFVDNCDPIRKAQLKDKSRQVITVKTEQIKRLGGILKYVATNCTVGDITEPFVKKISDKCSKE
jgi:hypothetical protein